MSTAPCAAQPRTIPQLLDRLGQEGRPDRRVMHEKQGGVWRAQTAARFLALIRRTALGLYALGVQPGSRVALCAESSPEWVIADYALASLGAVTVPIHTVQKAPEILSIVKTAGITHCIISGGAVADRFESILKETAIRVVIQMAPASAGSRFRVLEEVRARGDELAAAQPALFNMLRNSVKEDTPACLIYTWGMAGVPRATALTHGEVMACAADARAALGWTRKDAALSFLPLSHLFERTIIAMALMQGVKIYFAESLERVPQDMQEVHPTVFTTVPVMLEELYARMRRGHVRLKGMKRFFAERALAFARAFDPERRPSLLRQLERAFFSRLVYAQWKDMLGGRVRSVVSRGGALPPELARTFWTAGMPVLQAYGLTEDLPIISINRCNANRIGSAGRVMPGMEVRIAEDGEICVRRSQRAARLPDGRSEEHAPRACEERWCRTGDLGHVDKEGYLFVTGGRKQLLRKNSEGSVLPTHPSSFRSFHQQ